MLSKNGKRLGRPPKAGKDNGVKWGDPDAKKRKPNRELSEAEKMHVIACYQKTEDIEKCAKEVGTTWDQATAVVTAAIQDNPESFHTGQAARGMSVLLRFIVVQAMKHGAENIGKLNSTQAMLTAKYAGQMADTYDKVAKEFGANTGGDDLDGIREQRERIKQQLAAIEQGGDAAPVATVGAAGVAAEDSDAMAQDAGCGGNSGSEAVGGDTGRVGGVST